MAELVDALVSNTNGAIRAGSIPALGTEGEESFSTFLAFFFNLFWEYCTNKLSLSVQALFCKVLVVVLKC